MIQCEPLAARVSALAGSVLDCADARSRLAAPPALARRTPARDTRSLIGKVGRRSAMPATRMPPATHPGRMPNGQLHRRPGCPLDRRLSVRCPWPCAPASGIHDRPLASRAPGSGSHGPTPDRATPTAGSWAVRSSAADSPTATRKARRGPGPPVGPRASAPDRLHSLNPDPDQIDPSVRPPQQSGRPGCPWCGRPGRLAVILGFEPGVLP